MTMLSIVCTKLLSTNAHLGRRVADHHFKVYIRGSRNGIAILDSDKTLICLRNALHFIGSLSRQKGRFFFLKTNHLFYLEIMEEMVSYFRNVNSHCFDDSQWKIGAFLTNSFANKKKFRSRKKKIHFGLNQQPDCVVILNADRKSSVILEAHRSQIPIASLGDSTIPWESSKRITYTIPANDSIQFVYLFCHLIMKTVIIEKNAIKVVSQTTKALKNSTFSGKTAYSSLAHSRNKKKQIRMRLAPNSLFKRHLYELFDALVPYGMNAGENLNLPQPQEVAAPVVVVQDTPPPQGFTDLHPLPLPLNLQPDFASESLFMLNVLRHNNNIIPSTSTPPIFNGGAGPSTSTPPMDDFSPAVTLWTKAHENLFHNLNIENSSLGEGERETLDQLMRKAEELYFIKCKMITQLKSLAGPVNGPILWNTHDAFDAIRQENGTEFNPSALKNIFFQFQSFNLNNIYRGGVVHYNQFTNERLDSIPLESYNQLRAQDLPLDDLDNIHHVNFGCPLKNQRTLLTNQINLRRNPGVGS